MTAIPIVMSKAGRVNTPPAELRQELVDSVAAIVPDYTANLPASLIEDTVSTDVGSLVILDQAVTDIINSVTPRGANEFILNQLGAIYGVDAGGDTNTSVYVVFTGNPGWVISKGFTVGDGTHQYVVQDGGIVGAGSPLGDSLPLYCLATIAGAWAVPDGTVTQLLTAVPSTVTLSVTNPQDGTPSPGPESVDTYRSKVLQAGRAASMGMASYMKTLLGRVPGVQQRLISVLQAGGGGWEVLVGGGDPYYVANAIFTALFDINTLVGSSDPAINIATTIADYPNTYTVTFVNPPIQEVSIGLLYGTISPNIVAPAAVAQAGAPALAAYVNSVAVGQPMNLFELERAFQTAVADIIDPAFLTRMAFTVDIDGTPTAPDAGTGIIAGNPEGYFHTTVVAITIAPG